MDARPLYMAPEILQHGDRYSLAVDVFSFGVLLWELYTEIMPYNQFIHPWGMLNKNSYSKSNLFVY